jgi:hypothetical protein
MTWMVIVGVQCQDRALAHSKAWQQVEEALLRGRISSSWHRSRQHHLHLQYVLLPLLVLSSPTPRILADGIRWQRQLRWDWLFASLHQG